MFTALTIIFLVSFIAATISGAAGFGGALLMTPILSGIVGINAAIPVITIGQIFGNASRVWFGRKELNWTNNLFLINILLKIENCYKLHTIKYFRLKCF